MSILMKSVQNSFYQDLHRDKISLGIHESSGFPGFFFDKKILFWKGFLINKLQFIIFSNCIVEIQKLSGYTDGKAWLCFKLRFSDSRPGGNNTMIRLRKGQVERNGKERASV